MSNKVREYTSVSEARHATDVVSRVEMQEFVALFMSPFIQKVYKVDNLLQILLEWMTGDFRVSGLGVRFQAGALVLKDGKILVDEKLIHIEGGKLDFDLEGFGAYSLKRKKELEAESVAEMRDIVTVEKK